MATYRWGTRRARAYWLCISSFSELLGAVSESAGSFLSEALVSGPPYSLVMTGTPLGCNACLGQAAPASTASGKWHWFDAPKTVSLCPSAGQDRDHPVGMGQVQLPLPHVKLASCPYSPFVVQLSVLIYSVKTWLQLLRVIIKKKSCGLWRATVL